MCLCTDESPVSVCFEAEDKIAWDSHKGKRVDDLRLSQSGDGSGPVALLPGVHVDYSTVNFTNKQRHTAWHDGLCLLLGIDRV